MSIADITPRVSYTANGVQTSFDFSFPIVDEEDIVVQVTPPNEVSTTLVLATNYTVTRENNSWENGGSVNMVEYDPTETPYVYPAGYVISIYRLTRRIQPSVYVEGRKFSQVTLMTNLDRLTMIMQDLAYVVDYYEDTKQYADNAEASAYQSQLSRLASDASAAASQISRLASVAAQSRAEAARDEAEISEAAAQLAEAHAETAEAAAELAETNAETAATASSDSAIVSGNAAAASVAIYEDVAAAQAQTNALLGLGIGSSYISVDGDLIMTYNEATVSSLVIDDDGELIITY